MDFVKHCQHTDENEALHGDENTVDKRPKKRRKTDGDQASSNSKFHTQTLTQLEHWSSTATEDPEDGDVFDVPSSPRSLGFRHKNPPKPSHTLQSTPKSVSRRKSASRKMSSLQTPQKATAQEIPSSQSPETPLSSRLHTSAGRSPLKEKPANSPIYFPTGINVESICYSSPRLKIEGRLDISGETIAGNRPSPVKTVRFNMPEDMPKRSTASPSVKRKLSQATPLRRSSNYINPKLEILDSEAESDLDDKEDELLLEKQVEDEKPESIYGSIGVETQMIADGLISQHNEESQVVYSGPGHQEFEEETQVTESQRLSTQQMNSMAPRTGDSDVFISMHPQHVTNILDQTKDYVFFQWRLPPSVCRIWIYETSPTCRIKYMAVIGPEKHPNEIQSEDGIGNAEYNAKPKHSSNYAYEILELYELADPIPWAQICANEWLKTPPSKWSWVRPAVLDRLMANLKPALFIRSVSAHDIPPSSSTDTAEAEAQLLDTMMQFTEPTLHGESNSSQTEGITFFGEPSLSTTRRQSSQVPWPSQASTASFNGSQTPRSQTSADVIWESPTRPVPSSVLKLELSSPKQDYQRSDLMQPYSLDSSQLLTKSQMLPASLLSDSVPGPPLFIQDSEEEDD